MVGHIQVGHVSRKEGGWFFASQGPHRVSVRFKGDIVRDGDLWRRVQARALAALAVAKLAQQQLRRPPAPDSRPRRCHAKPKGDMLICRRCGISWKTNDLVYPDCKGDEI